ncbi:hypothetical protein [Cronobacter universalis]|nr:hypothetical protein [Cronobacter universalis]
MWLAPLNRIISYSGSG